MKGDILITPRSLKSGDPALDLFEKAGYRLKFCKPGTMPDKAELTALIPGCVGYLAGVETISASVLAAGSSLRAISRNGTGVDNIDLKAAERRNIAILRAEGANARGVAELAISLILSCARHVPFSDRNIKRGNWRRRRGVEVKNRILGVVGLGNIGRITARLAIALGMKIVAYDPYAPALAEFPADSFKRTDLEELWTEAEFVTLHCPLSRGRAAIVSEKSIQRMKEGVMIVNTARWELIEEKAVLNGLNSGKIGCLATDVFPKEPPQLSPLLKHENVVTTPHIGGFTKESVSKSASIAVENLLDFLSKDRNRTTDRNSL